MLTLNIHKLMRRIHTFPHKSKRCLLRNNKPDRQSVVYLWATVQVRGLRLLESQEFCCAFISQNDERARLSIQSLLSSVFCAGPLEEHRLLKLPLLLLLES